MVEDVCPLPRTGQNRPLPPILPPHVQIEDDLLDGGHCPTWTLATHKLLKSVDALVRLELLATTFADKHMAPVLPNFVLLRR